MPLDLDKINSATKYPSIPTYHALGEKGRLKEEVLVDFPEGEPVFVTEKIDGTNSRIILFDCETTGLSGLAGKYIIGSREELLHAAGDLIFNPAQGIVPAILQGGWAATAQGYTPAPVWVIYGEVYGGKTTAASKQYTGGDASKVGFRVFDVAAWASASDFLGLLEMEREAISLWRENGGQPFVSLSKLDAMHFQSIERVPQIMAEKPPRGLQETFSWLKAILPGPTLAALPGANPGRPEGVVVRSADRKKIAKIRFEDYERTLGPLRHRLG